MRRSWTLTAKLGTVGGALLAAVMVAIGLTLWVTWQLEGGAAAVNEAGRLRMQTWRLAQALTAEPSTPGANAAATSTAPLVERFDRTLQRLRAGDPAHPLFVPRDTQSQAALDEVERRWQALRADWAQPLAPAQVAAQAGEFVDRVDLLVNAIERQLARWTAILSLFQAAMVAMAFAGGVALLYTAHQLVLSPLAGLRRGLAGVEAGDLGSRVEVHAHDEFGAVASAFNRMAQTLQGLYQTLESRVQEKTQRLETEHARLAALYEATAFVARADTLDELAQGFARQMRRIGRADASAIRWSDEGNRRYVMLASDCLPQQMLDDEHCVATGECLCGQPQAMASTRVIAIHAEGGPDMLGHCRRAGYETVISVPLRLHERLVGELNLFYRSEALLVREDRTLLETLASHLAGAMESLRAGALEREAAVAAERGMLARELHDSIAQSLAFLKIQVQLLRDGRRRGDEAMVERAIGELDVGVRESTADVRELLLHFRTRTNAEDIVPALQLTLRKFEHQSGLTAHLSVGAAALPLAPDVQVQVLHVVQEALSNVRKHADARAVWVEVQQSPRWRVEVRDDGRGFAGEPGPDDTHVGLRIMRERAGRIGATVEVESAPGAGTRVVLELPQRQEPQEPQATPDRQPTQQRQAA